MSGIATLRRRAYTAALVAFRRLPAVVRRSLVSAGTPGFTVGAVCALEHGDHMLFLRQPHRAGWSLPGGLLGRGESPREAVVREVREETGLEVEVGLPVTTHVNARVRRVDVIYAISVPSRPEVSPGGEAKDARWLLPEEVLPDADGPTREILALLHAVRREGAYDGRVLTTGS
ncbi:MAG: NUDIX hydrolase [Actinomycetota bacterium]